MRQQSKVLLTYQEVEDIKSALSFFARKYQSVTKMRAPETIKAMQRLEKRLWKIEWKKK